MNSAEILLWNSSHNGNIAFKSVMWRRFWSSTLAISLLFSSDLEKFKLETQIKTFKNIAHEKKRWNKRSNINDFIIKCISKAVSIWSVEACKVPMLLVPTTNIVRKRLRSMLCTVKTYQQSSMTQEPLRSCLIVTAYKNQVDKE